MKIDPNSKEWYYDKSNIERTKSRMNQLVELGMEEVGIAQFGIKNIMSGLYIELVWNYDEKSWNSYIDWVKELIKSKSK